MNKPLGKDSYIWQDFVIISLINNSEMNQHLIILVGMTKEEMVKLHVNVVYVLVS